MQQLNYETLEKIGYSGYLLKDAPEKVMQFGEGNFLRAFADVWFDLANERTDWNGKVVFIQPIVTGPTELVNQQEGLFTVCLRGRENGEKTEKIRVISSVSRAIDPHKGDGFDRMLEAACGKDLEIIVSNTTEAGIVYDPACRLTDRPASSFPGKLTQVLYARFRAGGSPLIILACELIEANGKKLQECVNLYIDQWQLPENFRSWINEACMFCGSLVDRIVPGKIRNPEEGDQMEGRLGYRDGLLDVGEVYGLWVIESPAGRKEELEERLPFRKAGLEEFVFVTENMAPYKKRKVRILNGAHTGFVPGAYLAGEEIVRDCMEHPVIRGFMEKMLQEEIIPCLGMDREDALRFAAAVTDRFNNPFVDHALLSISLNSTSKWRARNMPSFLDFWQEKQKLPACLTMSLAAYIAFYSSQIQALTEEGLVCRRPAGDTYVVRDDRWVLEFYMLHREDSAEQLTEAVLANRAMWGQNLAEIPGLTGQVTGDLTRIRERGALEAFRSCLEE